MWLFQGVSCFRSRARQIYGFVLTGWSQPPVISHLGGRFLCLSSFLWLVKLQVPCWTRPMSLFSAHSIRA